METIPLAPRHHPPAWLLVLRPRLLRIGREADFCPAVRYRALGSSAAPPHPSWFADDLSRTLNQPATALCPGSATHPGRPPLGEWLEELGFATEQQVTAALARQWACPVLAPTVQCDPNCTRLLPYYLLETSRMLPVQFVPATRTFHLAFCDGIDYAALYAIEQMLDCRTQPCLATRSAVAQLLPHREGKQRTADMLFEGWREPSDLARITCGYVLKLGAQEVRLVGCGSFIWARLSAGLDVANLLFQRPSGASLDQTSGFDIASAPFSTSA